MAIGAGLLLFVLLAAVAVRATAVPTQAGGVPLRDLAADHGIRIGAAANPYLLEKNREYRSLLGEQYGSLTAENVMKWDTVQPERGVYDFSHADALVDFAEKNGQKMRGHTLLWHNQNPEWLSDGDFGPDELRSIMHDHIRTVVGGHFKGRMYAWDVINEPFRDNGGELRRNLWLRTLGEGYIADALRTAHAADPDARLYINDFSIEGRNAKSDALYALAESLLEQGVPLHGIGFQSHLSVGDVPGDMVENMRRFTDLGLEVTITELDISIDMPAREAELRAQADDYRTVVRNCLKVSRCTGVTVWGVGDADSWIPSWFPGQGAALPFDQDYSPKLAFGALQEELSKAGIGGTPFSPDAAPSGPGAAPTGYGTPAQHD
ncbi:endo-1,4-beta-xylanase [Streptomonospora wellingtoniae]|uniref:Beta-xylanase n=1 Tax=Streptomonospora wellingtoniae TaxID=3075544 RepID=A0ABU2KTI7_9ACTN|nr:endo-1,4-beta-xylanase [Streptomonospora sp. DSM 45055]MDT0302565.1 endo-1,4-beta-xylanase [Streptomonospora sp. DSM 45055]